MMKKRLPFRCWSCNRKYTLFKEITENQELIVQCPYCNAEAVAKLKPYERKKITVVKGDDEQAIGYEYDFPEIIPTEKPEE